MTGLSRHPIGSRFTGGVTAPLHGHSRRASPEYVDCSVVVGIGAESACHTDEVGLALATSFVHGSAGRTGLRCVGGIDLYERPAALLQLVAEQDGKGAPALRQDRSVQAALATTARRHVRYFQILEHDSPKTFSYRIRGSMLPVAPDTSHLRRQHAQLCLLLAASDRASLAAGQLAPRSFYPMLNGTHGWQLEHLSVRQGQRLGDAPIYTNCRVVICWRLVIHRAGKADMPAIRVSYNCCPFSLAMDRPGASKLHPSNLWKPNGTPSAIDRSYGNMMPRYPEAIIIAFPARFRVASSTSKEAGKGIVQISQGLMQTVSGNSADPFNFCSQGGHFPPLADKVEALASAERPALLKSQVVNKARDASELRHQLSLFWRRIEAKLEGAVHIKTLAKRVESVHPRNLKEPQ